MNISIVPSTLIGTTAPCWLSAGPPNENFRTGDEIAIHAQQQLAAGVYTGTLTATDGANSAAADVTFNVGAVISVEDDGSIPPDNPTPTSVNKPASNATRLATDPSQNVISSHITLLTSKPSRDVRIKALSARSPTFTAVCRGCDPWLSIDTHGGKAPGTLTLKVKDARSYSEKTPGYVIITGFDGAAKLNEVTLNVAFANDGPVPLTGPVIRDLKPVLQAFDFSERLSPGTWIQIFGTDLAPPTCGGRLACSWMGSDFNGIQAKGPLQGVQVLVNCKQAYLSFVRSGAADSPPTPDQVNAQVPDETQLPAANGPVTVQVLVNGVASNTVRVNKTNVSPALLFINVGATTTNPGKNYLAAQKSDFSTFLGVQGFPALPAGSTVTVYAVGCGAATPATPGGQIVQPPLHRIPDPVEFTIGATRVIAAGFMAPTAVGLCQFNVTLPPLSTTFTVGEKAVDVKLNGVATGQTLYTIVGPP